MTDPDRTYRFAPADRAGWLLGLTGTQCLLIGGGLAATALGLQTGVPPQVAALGAITGAAGAFVPLGGHPAHETAGTAIGWSMARRRRRPHLPPLPATTTIGKLQALAPPPVFGAIELVAVERPPWAGRTRSQIGIVLDRKAATATIVVRVDGGGFSLAGPAEQQRALAGWGDLLGGFCTEHTPTTHVAVSHWSLPAGNSTNHDVLVAVTVRTPKTKKGEATAVAAAVALDEARRLAERAATAEINCSNPLSPPAVMAAVRSRLNPLNPPRPGRPISVNWPLAWQAEWAAVRVEAAVHRSWWISEWPRLHVPANWLEPLLTTPGTWALTVHFQPVAPSAARRRIDRDATRLASDATQRAERGFRIGARHHRAEAAVAEREAELVAGYPEIGFCGLLTATAANQDDLDTMAGRLEHAAATVGLEVRRLDGRHDQALATALPLGRPVNTPRLS